jgi:hypothetical protein
METRQIGSPKLLVGMPGTISQVCSRLLRFALALWIRRVERQLEEFTSVCAHQQLLCARRSSLDEQARAYAKRTLCRAICS